MMKIRAQALYDFREQRAFCSGTDLHEFFRKELGEPSPSGRRLVRLDKATEFVAKSLNNIRDNNATDLHGYCDRAKAEWLQFYA